LLKIASYFQRPFGGAKGMPCSDVSLLLYFDFVRFVVRFIYGTVETKMYVRSSVGELTSPNVSVSVGRH